MPVLGIAGGVANEIEVAGDDINKSKGSTNQRMPYASQNHQHEEDGHHLQ